MWPTKYLPFPIKPRVTVRFYLTTHPYPIELLEQMQGSVIDVGGYDVVTARETLTASASLQSGAFVQYSYETGYAFENLQASTSLVSGAFVQYAYEYGYAFENLQAQTAFLSGKIERLLVRYLNWPLGVANESLKAEAALLSGTLL